MNFHHFISYNVEEAEKSNSVQVQTIVCCVNFLDNTSLNFIVSKDCIGQYLLDLVLDYQHILEKEFFGLLYDYSDRSTNIQRWLNPDKKIIKVYKNNLKYVFYLNFRYYVPDPIYLQEEYTRYHFFLQLRKNLYNGYFEVCDQTLGNLGGLILQAELEGFNPEETTPGYTLEFNIIKNPKKAQELEPLFVSWHKKLKDLSQPAAELNFINICCQSEFYGSRLFNAVDQYRNQVQILSNHKGIMIFKNKTKIILQKWDNIKKIDYRRKVINIKLKNPINNPLSGSPNQWETSFKFFSDSPIESKVIWEECVSCHAFFRIRPIIQQSDIIHNEVCGITGQQQTQNIYMAIPNIEKKKQNIFARIFSFNRKVDQSGNFRRLDRTMSSVLELRKKSKLNERGIVRSYSKRSSARHIQNNNSNPLSTVNLGVSNNSFLKNSPQISGNQSNLDRLPENKSIKIISSQEIGQRVADSISRNKSGSNQKLFRDSNRKFSQEEFEDSQDKCNNLTKSERKSRSSGKIYKDPEIKSQQDDLIDSSEVPDLSAVLCRDERNFDNFAVDFDDTEASTVIRIKQDATRRYGFNIRGGKDHGMPIIVSRIGENMPADLAIPRLHEGDQILSINGIDTNDLTHDEVVNIILKTPSTHSELVLVVKARIYDPKDGVEEGGGPDSGDAPPLPPRPINLEIKEYSKASLLSQISSISHGTHNTQENLNPHSSKRSRLQKSDTANQEKLLIDWNYIQSSSVELVNSIKIIEMYLCNGSLIEAFRKLDKKSPNLTTNTAKVPENMAKNRYRDILPYDQTRVILKESSSNYINANHIKTEIPGTNHVNRYIAAQGPLTNTCGDFWLMCWEQNCNLVVMVTTNVEKGRIKCHQYWPMLNKGFLFNIKSKKASQFIEIKIATVGEKKYKNMIEREMVLSCSKVRSPNPGCLNYPSMTTINDHAEAMKFFDDNRKIVQIQFTNWPDHGTPDNPNDLLELVDRMKLINAGHETNPVIVHCSAGIGRTGVLITMETARDLIDKKLPVSPIEIIKKIRSQRAMLVQTEAQFLFLNEAILKYFEKKFKV